MNLSIIIPTLHRHKRLERTIKLIARELRSCDEIIVITNTSDTEIIQTKLQDITDKSKCLISIYYEKRLGVSFARNSGLTVAHGDVIMFIDDDIELESGWLESVIDLYKTHGLEKRYVFCPQVTNVYHQHDWRQCVHQLELDSSHDLEVTYQLSSGLIAKDNLQALAFFGSSQLFNELSPFFDADRYPFWGEEQDLAVRLHLQHIHIITYPAIKVKHFKKFITIPLLLARSFYTGRVSGVNARKYLTNSSNKKMFTIAIGSRYSNNDKKSAWNYFKTKLHNPYHQIFAMTMFYIDRFVFALGFITGKMVSL